MSRNNPRGPHRNRPKGEATVTRRCLKCDKEFEATAGFHICSPCTWENLRLERIYGHEGVQAPSWWR